jgi:GNAT superfamily N-acetyltransferase
LVINVINLRNYGLHFSWNVIHSFFRLKDNEEKVALQIGTVMTLPDYRNKGLSAFLMNKVLETFEGLSFNYEFAAERIPVSRRFGA